MGELPLGMWKYLLKVWDALKGRSWRESSFKFSAIGAIEWRTLEAMIRKMGFIQRPIVWPGKVLSRSYRVLFVFLQDHYSSGTQNASQSVVTKKTGEEQCRQKMMTSWSCIVVVDMERMGWNWEVLGDEEAQTEVISWTYVVRENEEGSVDLDLSHG